ncbi:MAG TPA: hypothetical protein VEZ44_02880 [bacterium]|nr:hypothetical protein [bacterium]
MGAVGRWVAAVAVGVIVFEGLDLLGSSPAVTAWLPVAASLPTLSPFACGAAATGTGRLRIVPALLAAAVAVWARIGVDRAVGTLEGAHPPAEYGLVLVLAFGVPWMLSALAGGAITVLVRGAARRWTRGPVRPALRP